MLLKYVLIIIYVVLAGCNFEKQQQKEVVNKPIEEPSVINDIDSSTLIKEEQLEIEKLYVFLQKKLIDKELTKIKINKAYFKSELPYLSSGDIDDILLEGEVSAQNQVTILDSSDVKINSFGIVKAKEAPKVGCIVEELVFGTTKGKENFIADICNESTPVYYQGKLRCNFVDRGSSVWVLYPFNSASERYIIIVKEVMNEYFESLQ